MNTMPALERIAIQNVAYATDFKNAAKLALPYALSVARHYNSKVYVAHVIDLVPFSAPSPTSALRAIESQAIREAREAAVGLRPLFGQVPNEVLIRKGDIWKEISRIIDEKHADLIVVGTHGREGLSKVILGSIAETIFRQAPCPVLTVGPKIRGDSDPFARLHAILVPVDFSLESQAAVLYGTSLAETHQARLYLLHVAPGTELPDVSLKQTLRNLIPTESNLSFVPKILVEAGVPSEQILDIANELAVDLIVLGVKRPGVFMGTATHQTMATACKVVSSAECPVITVRAPVQAVAQPQS